MAQNQPLLTALVLIDVQERLAPAMADFEACLANQRLWLEAAPLLGLPVIVTEQYPRGLGPTLPELAALMTTPPIAKVTFSCFGTEAFAAAVAPYEELIVVGLEAHVCVLLTVLDGLARGLRIAVADDAVTSRSPAHRESGLRAAARAGALVAPTETLLFRQLGSSAHDGFRAISRMIR